MKLLFLEQVPRFGGGSERMSLSVCRHALGRGHQAWLAHESPGDMVPAYASAGASCVLSPLQPIAVRQPATALRSFRALVNLVARHAIDVVFTSQVNYASLVAAVGRWTGVHTAMHLGLVYDYPSPVFRTGIRHIDLGVVPSEDTADGWRARGWPAGSLCVIPNGVDAGVFSPGDGRAAARRRLGLPEQDKLVAYVGRLVPEKGIYTLARAFAKYRQTHGAGQLLYVGPAVDGEAARLAAFARSEGLPSEACLVRPPTSAPEDAYRAADLVVVPTEGQESFGLAPVEAMSCGTLAVVSDCGVLPRFVAPLNGAAVFASGNADALASRLVRWLEDDRGREQAAALVSAHVRATFGFESCGDAYLAAFARLLTK